MHSVKKRRKNSLRLKGWDYRASAYYFITFCTHQKQKILESQEIIYLINKTWTKIPTWKNFQHFQNDSFIVMPNHIHGVIWIRSSNWSIDPLKSKSEKAGSIGAAVGTLKSNITLTLRSEFGYPFDEPVWQRGYYDRVVRNPRELNAIREYIRLNPIRRLEERVNWDSLVQKMTFHNDNR